MITLALVRRIFAPGVVLCAAILAGGANAQGDDAVPILKRMSAYIGGRSTIQATFDSDIEVVTDDLQKVQFASSGQVILSRPDKLRASRTGGYADVELVFDGKKVTVFGKNIDAYAQADFSGNVDQLIDKMRSEFGIEAPGADLLLSRSFDDLMTGVYDAKHVGRGVIEGVECEHLAFRSSDTDWQIWIEAGTNPVPRKFVITSKTVTGAPQYTLRIRDWKTNSQPPADAFAFQPAAEAKQVVFGSLVNIDEVPPGSPQGGKK
ncbi:hypothetical protein AS156_28785 [Bradyrhizobium macuxiense]|uniref:DUF2092 domain-containing protein n=1 Tax=Bradyrhizobium macuxiense TaxID=1755647 RepID=A0A109K4F6_9BRAD|nr:DUF2092 domain-containing protein [Bradyrhizobium macuxiense]KWV60398.1 hypothetical protein AS156_28785 [Bradyrhizobium macuxiense]